MTCVHPQVMGFVPCDGLNCQCMEEKEYPHVCNDCRCLIPCKEEEE